MTTKILNKKADINKAGGIIIENRKLLVERSKGKDFFIAPGGSIEKEETAKEALVRELKEEFDIKIQESDLKKLDTFYADAAGDENKIVKMSVYTVKKYQGRPKPSSEVEKILWITSKIPQNIKVGSIFEHEVIPRLKKLNLID